MSKAREWSLPIETLVVNSDFNRPNGVHVREVLPDMITISREEFIALVKKHGVGCLLNNARVLTELLFGPLASRGEK